MLLRDFGLTDYETVRSLQKNLVDQRLREEIPDMLLLGEHPPVLTAGRGFHEAHLLNPALPVVMVERGGDITYHGPGQLIAYPIIRLPEGARDLRRYLWSLEEGVIRAIRVFGLSGVRVPGQTGVWIVAPEYGARLKIASIGVAVKKWVTYHGVALNVCPDMEPFLQIRPCGLESAVMTSMQTLLQAPLDMAAVKHTLYQQLRDLLPQAQSPECNGIIPA